MPVPPPSFTKNKWLAFFAEITSKVTHHNAIVVIEGCELLKRLLLTRVSVAVVLEEGTLLRHLLDVSCIIAQVEALPTDADNQMMFSLFQCLTLITDLATSLFFEGDEYYSLLVLARSGEMLQSLTQLLHARQRRHIGPTCDMIRTTALSATVGSSSAPERDRRCDHHQTHSNTGGGCCTVDLYPHTAERDLCRNGRRRRGCHRGRLPGYQLFCGYDAPNASTATIPPDIS